MEAFKGFSHGVDVTSYSSGRKDGEGKPVYNCLLHIDSEDELDSVTYFLNYKLRNPIVTLRYNDSVGVRYPSSYTVQKLNSKELRGNDFNYITQTTEAFPMMASLFFRNGSEIECYVRVEIPELGARESKMKIIVILSSIVGLVITVVSVLVTNRKRKHFVKNSS